MQELLGRIIVAAPNMIDKNFARTVIYIANAEKGDGVLGFVINRPSRVKLRDIAEQIHVQAVEPHASSQIYHGGPVGAQQGFVLHSPDYADKQTLRNHHRGVYMSNSLDVMRAIARNQGPKSYRLLLGYAGWGDGQLTEEVKRHDWLISPFSIDYIFGTPIPDLWQKLIDQMNINIAGYSDISGSA